MAACSIGRPANLRKLLAALRSAADIQSLDFGHATSAIGGKQTAAGFARLGLREQLAHATGRSFFDIRVNFLSHEAKTSANRSLRTFRVHRKPQGSLCDGTLQEVEVRHAALGERTKPGGVAQPGARRRLNMSIQYGFSHRRAFGSALRAIRPAVEFRFAHKSFIHSHQFIRRARQTRQG